MRKKAIELTKTWNKDLTAGAAIEGKYLKKEVYEGNFGMTEKYIIETPEGDKYGVFASASLIRQFKQVPEGVYVWITYQGEETTKNGRPVKVYTVEYDDQYKN